DRVEELVLGLLGVAPRACLDQLRVRKRDLRVPVEHPRVRVRRQVVEVEVVLLHVLAVVPLPIRQAEQPLLQDRIAGIPQRNAETHMLIATAEAGQAVFTPAIGAAPSVIVWKVVPRAAIGAVVLAYCAPGPLAEVRPPPLPVRGAGCRRRQPFVLGAHKRSTA